MSSLALATVLHASLVLGGANSYADAHRATTETGKPMVVMVSAEWCGPCQRMKKSVLPEVERRGVLKKVAFAVVNVDRERSLARKLTGGGAVPQLIMFRRTKDGWMRRKLVGGQSVASVEKFINEGVAASEAEQPDGEAAESLPSSEESGAGVAAQPVGYR